MSEPDLPGADAKPLEGEQKEEWDKLTAAGAAISAALRSGDSAAVDQALDRLREAKIDSEAVLNALHIPSDAGALAGGIERILRRIPDGWGRWISCASGWYPIIVRLDQQLAELAPDYEVHQVKEKYGHLEYYMSGPSAVFDQMDELVEAARAEAARTCEVCGSSGQMCTSTGTMQGWYQTLCHSCAIETGYQALEPKEAESS